MSAPLSVSGFGLQQLRPLLLPHLPAGAIMRLALRSSDQHLATITEDLKRLPLLLKSN